MEIDPQALTQAAVQAAANAYCPYSGFRVGAALLADDGRVFTGCNVENVSFGLTVCAERTAIQSAVTAGCRTFKVMALVASGDSATWPCGACRQVMVEFCGPDFVVIAAPLDHPARAQRATLAELLPKAFGPRTF